MVNPKVKAAYEYSYTGNVFYTAFDLSDYENDVKSYTRKLEIFRTDTGQLVRSQVLNAGEFKIGTLIQSGLLPNDPYLNNLGIKAVLTIDGIVVDEDIISFTSPPINPPTIINPVSVIKTENGYTINDNTQTANVDRFAISLRRNTSNAQLNKLQYIKQMDSASVSFDYFNEMVVYAYVLYFDKTTNQVITRENAAFVYQNDLLAPLYNAGGIYRGTPNYDPLGNEDALPNYSFLDNQNGNESPGMFGNFLRPHILKWDILTDGGQTDEGYPLPGTTTTVQVPCRFVPGGTRVFKNADSTEQGQKGRIRVDVGSPMPKQGQLIEVVGLFNGIAQEVYSGGHLTGWRIDV